MTCSVGPNLAKLNIARSSLDDGRLRTRSSIALHSRPMRPRVHPSSALWAPSPLCGGEKDARDRVSLAPRSGERVALTLSAAKRKGRVRGIALVLVPLLFFACAPKREVTFPGAP